jgi:hypothetical protein
VGLGSVRRRQCTGSLLRSWDRCDEHAVGLSILPYEEIVAAAVDEAGFLVEGDGAGVALPDTEPEGLPTEFARGGVHGAHELLRNAFAVSAAIDIEAM